MLPLSERHSLLVEQLQCSPGWLQVIILPFFDLLIVLIGFAVTKNRTHCLVVITILIRSPRFNQHQNWLVWHLQCLRKIIRYYWSDVLTNTPLPTHNLEFSMGLLRSSRNQVLSIMFFFVLLVI